MEKQTDDYSNKSEPWRVDDIFDMKETSWQLLWRDKHQRKVKHYSTSKPNVNSKTGLLYSFQFPSTFDLVNYRLVNFLGENLGHLQTCEILWLQVSFLWIKKMGVFSSQKSSENLANIHLAKIHNCGVLGLSTKLYFWIHWRYIIAISFWLCFSLLPFLSPSFLLHFFCVSPLHHSFFQ